MEYQEAYDNLKERAQAFHKVLVSGSTYHKQLSEDNFLEIIEDKLRDSAERIASGIASGRRYDPWANVLGFCEILLFDLKEYLFTIWFDAMEGPQEHMGALKRILSQAGYEFSWDVDSESKVVRFKVEDVEWEGPYYDGWWCTDEPFSTNEPNLTDFLRSNGWFLFSVATGDATGTYLLVPTNIKEALKKFLVPGFSQVHPEFDPRVEWLYSGVPEDKRPPNLWDI